MTTVDDEPDTLTVLKDGKAMNAVVRLITALCGAGCVVFAGYQAVHYPETWVTVGFLITAVVLLILALASEPTPTS